MKSLSAALLLLVLAVPLRARAVYQCGANKDDCQCGAYDPYPCCSNGGNCTWWAWEAACCNWGIGLRMWGNATDWAGNARAQGFTVQGSPDVGTIANEHSGWNACYGFSSQYGHVAWTDGLSGGGVHVSEQNCDYGAGSARPNWYRTCFFDNGFIAHGVHRECNPGDSQVQGCGLCGTQRRGCDGSGHWGGWSGCDAQGECAPGQTQTQGCCDCGTQTRSCDGACHWTAFSGCEGPDPAGAPSCDTGKLGVCADGTKRCVHGCLACVENQPPSPEVCDGKDDDCNGQVDDGEPRTLGSPPPAFAASVVDASYPRRMAPGSTSEAWVELHNDGTETWRAGAVSLHADAPSAGTPSALAPEHGWPAFDTAAVLGEDVPPGGTAVLRFPIRAGKATDIDETFTLTTPDGRAIACPEPRLRVTIATAGETVGAKTSALSTMPGTAKARAGCSSTGLDAFAIVAALAFLVRRRRA